MIINVLNEDIFKTSLKNIAFAINKEGYNDSGFAGVISEMIPEFTNTTRRELGELFTLELNGINFHGIVCHELKLDGWTNAPKAITSGLNKIRINPKESVAVVLMGSGTIGFIAQVDIKCIIKAIHASTNSCIIYTLDYSKEAIMNVIYE